MTEAEWLAATDPKPMLEFLEWKTSDRKLRLLLAADSEQIRHLLPKRCLRVAILLEEYADGLVGTEEYQEAGGQADIECQLCAHDPPNATVCAAQSVMIASALTIASVVSALATAATAFGCDSAIVLHEIDYERAVELGRLWAANEQAELVRCIFGNPLRPITLNPSWLTSTVLALANGIYSEKAFDRMPILADALQDADCDNEDILNHCRQAGEHVRGCWVVDLLTDRK